MAKWVLAVIAIAGSAWFFKDSIKKFIWKIKHRKHDFRKNPDPDCWFCKEDLRKEKARQELLQGGGE